MFASWLADSAAWAVPVNTALLVLLTVVTNKFRRESNRNSKIIEEFVPDETANRVTEKLANGAGTQVAEKLAVELDRMQVGGRRRFSRRATDPPELENE